MLCHRRSRGCSESDPSYPSIGIKECNLAGGRAGEQVENLKAKIKLTESQPAVIYYHASVNPNHIHDKILLLDEANLSITPSFGVPLKIHIWEKHISHFPVSKTKPKSWNKIYVKLMAVISFTGTRKHHVVAIFLLSISVFF